MSEHSHRRSPSSVSSEHLNNPSTAPGRSTRTGKLMRKAAGPAATGGADAALEAAGGSSGQALPGQVRGTLEGSLGTDLAAVRVHTGPESAQAASAVGARAFTVGQDIHFGAGKFDPSSDRGQQLIAHEVAHTVQQRGGDPTRQNALEVSQPADSHEVEADRFATAFVSGFGQVAPVSGNSVSGSISRDGEEEGGVGDMALDWVVDRIDDVSSLVSALSTVSASMARMVINTIAARAPGLILSFIELHPAHQLMTYAIRQVPRDQVAALFARIDTAQVARIVRALADAGLLAAYGPIIFALDPERARQIIQNLDDQVVEPLYRTANAEARQFVTQVLDQVWPVGVGINVSAGLGATFGYPIYVGGDAMFVLARMTQENFEFRRRGEARVAADSGAGVGAFVGTGGRSRGGGTSGEGGAQGGGGIGIGASAGVQGQAGLKMIVDQKFGFPVFEDNAFLSMIIAVSGNDTSTSFMVGRMLFDCIADLDPMLYNTSTKLEAKLYAEGNARAEAGIRVADEGTIEEPESWSTREGQNSSSVNTGNRTWWSKLLGLCATLTASAGAEAGIGVELQQHFGEDRSAGPEHVDLELSVEASAALQAVHSIPWLSAHIPQLPGLDGAMGAKIRLRATGPGQTEGDPQLERVGLSMYAKTGETDLYQGEASETEIFMDNIDEDTFSSLESFLEDINGGVRFFRRFSVGTTLGRKYMRQAGQQASFSAMLPDSYRSFGFTLEGYIDFKTHLSTDQVRAIFRTLASAVQEMSSGNDALQRLYTDLLTFFNTGEAPAYITTAAEGIANTMLSGLEELKLHGQAGMRLAAGGQVAEGAKVRLHGSAGAMITVDYDILQAIGGDQVTVDDIQELLTQGVDAARGYIEMGGDDAVDVQQEEDEEERAAGGGR
jgi:hypothetical protein